MAAFKADEISLLVCSDVVARGIDISGVSHVFNFDVPNNPEDYVHRIGRTGRAGKSGHAFTIVTPADKKLLQRVENLIKKEIPRIRLKDAVKEEGKPVDRKSTTKRTKTKGQHTKKTGANDIKSLPDESVLGFGNDMPAFFKS